MAERVLALAARPAAAVVVAFDAVIVAAAEDLALASELARRLRGLGLKVWPQEGAIEPATALAATVVLPAVRVALVVVGAADPWGTCRSLIRMFHKTREVVGVQLRGAPVSLGEVATVVPRWTDLRGGWHAEALGRLCQQILPAARREPVAGQLWVEPVTGIRLVYVPAGRFEMGSELISKDEMPVHWVRLSAFWLGETTVTNRQYGLFVAATKHREPELWRDDKFSDPEQPVVGVNWDDAQAFCAWLSSVAQVEASLPSEAQWEYAARGTDGRPYPWGWEAPDATRACFGRGDHGAGARVGSCPAGRGPFAALDQAGNVWEWCEDVWGDQAYRQAEQLDPVNRDEGGKDRRVLRGGSFWNDAGALVAAFRSWHWSRLLDGNLGFRVVVSASRVEP